MMIESFHKLVKNTVSPSISDEITVCESQNGATLKEMKIHFSKSSCIVYADKFIKTFKALGQFSRVYDNEKNCDGFAIVENGGNSVLFVELKSRFNSQKLEEGLIQILNSFFKVLPFILLSCDVRLFSMHFVLGCQCSENQAQDEGIMSNINAAFQMPRPNFGADILYPLLENGNLKLSLKEIVDSCDNVAKSIGTQCFNTSLMNSNVHISLVQTKNFGDTDVSFSI